MKIILKEIWTHNDTVKTGKRFLVGEEATVVKTVTQPGEISEDTYSSIKNVVKHELVSDKPSKQ